MKQSQKTFVFRGEISLLVRGNSAVISLDAVRPIGEGPGTFAHFGEIWRSPGPHVTCQACQVPILGYLRLPWRVNLDFRWNGVWMNDQTKPLLFYENYLTLIIGFGY
jgi:hypothetical protein